LALRAELGWPRLFNPPTGKNSQLTKWFIDFPLESSPRAIETHKSSKIPQKIKCFSQKTLDSILAKFQSKLACFSEIFCRKKLDSPGWLKGW
jgi:hypothetical protein